MDIRIKATVFLTPAILFAACYYSPSGRDHAETESPVWVASWIGAPWDEEDYDKGAVAPAPEFRKTFELAKPVARATAHVTGLGFFEFSVNGVKCGDEVLSPNESSYSHRKGLENGSIPMSDSAWRGFRVYYLDYDVTPLLGEGVNTLGMLVGNGFFAAGTRRWTAPYGTPRMLCQVDIVYQDGTIATVVSDTTWTVRTSPIILHDIYEGEVYDARLEDTGQWSQAVLRKAPDGDLHLQDGPADKIMEMLEPKSVVKLPDGRWEVDFGDYVTGWVCLFDIDEPEGTVISIDFPVEGDGYNGVYKYICSGGKVDSYAPRFRWWSFRKAVVSGWSGELSKDNIRAEVVYADVPENSTFDCSDTLLMRIHEIWRRTQKDNMHLGVATDCPHREMGPYTGDGQVACVTVLHNFDADKFYRKWLRDMSDCQDTLTGYVPNGAPWHPGCGGGVAWGAAMTIIPWEHYLRYGDISVLEEHYTAMAMQTDFMATWRTPEGIMQMRMPDKDNPLYWMNLGEWCPAYNLPKDELVHTYFLWKCADIMESTARALDRDGDAFRYANLRDEVWTAFHKVFYDPQTCSYGKDDGANVFALRMGVPDDRRDKVLASLVSEIEENGGHLLTGIFGTQIFFEVLCDYGLGEMAYTAMTKTDYPSYGYWVVQGADTTWEQWNGEASRNHPMFGGGICWLYTHLAGLRTDPTEPGYKHMIVKPLPLGNLTHAAYSTATSCGEASVSWERKDGMFNLSVVVPKGSHATVHMPGSTNPTTLKAGRHTLSVPDTSTI